MILGFKEFFDAKKQKPTYFAQKIILCVQKPYDLLIDGKRTTIEPAPLSERKFHVFEVSSLVDTIKPKLHTIREDKHDRWKPGMSIQMVFQ